MSLELTYPGPEAMASRKALDLLRSVYGYTSFRGQQQDIIEHVVAGKDAFVLMPTGAGKSLCFQLPALLRSGVTIVVSPLIALMQDQVSALLQLGVRAAFLNSSQTLDDARRIEELARHGALDLLYVAPERLVTPRFLALLDQLRAQDQLSLFAIDEAHCVSQWGHDFRPEYLGLSCLSERYPGVPRLALTATADEVTRQDIQERLQLQSARLFTSGFDRPNLYYSVAIKHNPRAQLLGFLQAQPQGSSGIIYCLSRRRTEETAEWLQKSGYCALPYHAGLESEVRRQHQERFLREDGIIMTATIAFGMGIDKPDVRFVAHLDLPKSVEAYYQETGRAGRDGQPANLLMLYGLADVVLHRQLLLNSQSDEAHRRIEQRKLDALLGFCETAQCRRQVLLGYFGEERHTACGFCDNCLHPPETFEGTLVAQKALSAVYRTGQQFGAAYLVDVLTGQANPRVLRNGHHEIKTFGVGTELDKTGWHSVLRQLIAGGLLTVDVAGHGSIKLTDRSWLVLRKELSILLRKDTVTEPAGKRGRRGKNAITTDKGTSTTSDPASAEAAALFELLRRKRREVALAQDVPPYVIFHDTTLREMATQRPLDLVSLARISGVGKTKLERYGAQFLQVLRGEESASAPSTDG